MANKRKIDISPEEMTELLKINSREEIAEQFNCSTKTINRYVKAHDIKSNRGLKDNSDIEQWYAEADRANLPLSLGAIQELTSFPYKRLKQFFDKQKARDLATGEQVLSWIKSHPDHDWIDKGHSFKTRNIKKLKFMQNRFTRKVNLILTLHDESIILRQFPDVEAFKKEFIK